MLNKKNDENLAKINLLQREVDNHRLFKAVSCRESLKIFMESHVFCVWDFMSLAKSLQQSFTCTTVPWIPPKNRQGARVMNEIILEEESDLISEESCSHLELYMDAMEEVGADLCQIESVLANIERGKPFESGISETVNPGLAFCKSTMETLGISSLERLAIFYYGRENVIPKMFANILTQFESKGQLLPKLRLYLERHIHLDGESHGPKIEQLLLSLGCQNQELYRAALAGACESLICRKILWEKTLERILTVGLTENSKVQWQRRNP